MSAHTKQPNGVVEMLTREQRLAAEEYYKSKNVGSTAQERYEHFRDTPELSGSIFYNIRFDRGTESDNSRLGLLEWTLWRWNGET